MIRRKHAPQTRRAPLLSLVLALGLATGVGTLARSQEAHAPEPPANGEVDVQDHADSQDGDLAVLAIPDDWWNRRRKRLDDRANDLREDFWERRLRFNLPITSAPLRMLIGLRAGGARIPESDVRLDPEKRATDSALGGNAIWVKHQIEIRPELNKNYVAFDLLGIRENWARSSAILPGINQQQVVELVRRHPLDREYSENFWSYARRDLSIAKKSLPLYFTLPISTTASDRLLPGESLSMERFVRLNLFVGPRINLLGSPAAEAVRSGLYVAFGARFSRIEGHFRTEIDMLRGERMRVTLSQLKSRGRGFTAALSAQAKALFFGLNAVIFRYTAESTISHEKLLDLHFTLTEPHFEARRALHAAIAGDFAPAMQLAEQAEDGDDTGVRRYSSAEMNQQSETRSTFFLTWLKDSAFTESTENAQFFPEDEGASSDEKTLSTRHHALKVSRSRQFGSQTKRFKAMLLTDLEARDLKRRRSFLAEFEFRDRHTNRAEMLELLRAARTLAPNPEKAREIQQWIDGVQKRNGPTQASFYIDFDPDALRTFVLSAPDEADGNSRRGRFFQAWAEVLDLDSPEAWGRATDAEREQYIRENDSLKRLYQNARHVADALDAASRIEAPEEQSREFMKRLRRARMDLYPFVAMAKLCGTQDVFSEFRLSHGKGKSLRTLESLQSGATYESPRPSYLIGDGGVF